MNRLASLGAALSLLSAAPALARDVGGVDVADTLRVQGADLKLNGAGLRRATIFKVKVYVGALYVAQPSKDPAAIVAADAPKAVRMRFVRDVGKSDVLKAFREGFENNSPADAKALEPSLEKLATVVPGEMKSGMELLIAYVPEKGTVVTGPEGTVTIPGKPFADALFRNWLGDKVADGDLKKALLGR
jgi:hypothetical protein